MPVRRYDIGKARHLITVRGFTSIPDGYGGFVDAETDLITAYAIKEAKTSLRDLDSAEMVNVSADIFIIRYRPDFTPTKDMKIVSDGKTYAINTILETSDKRWWELIAKVIE